MRNNGGMQMIERSRTADYRRFQDKKHKKRLKALSKHTFGVAWEVGVKDDEWMWSRDYKKSYIKRYYISGRKKYAKFRTNRATRHYKGDLNHPSDYQKLYDYWWEIW